MAGDRADDTGRRWLVVGLANPEAEYADTRHNAGGDALRVLAERHRAGLSRNRKVNAEVAEVRDGDVRLVLVRPSTYMNRSGGPVQQAAAWFKVPLERIVVLHDDLDLEVGALRLKRGGGNGGHNGLKDLDQRLGSADYLRVRIGIGRPPGRQDPADYVLRRFTPRDRELVDVVLEEAADAVGCLVREPLEACQNRFNRSSTLE